MAQRPETILPSLNLNFSANKLCATVFNNTSSSFKGKAVAGEHILSAKIHFFFGKIMLPEFTCGKLILPFRFQFMNFGDYLRVNRRKLMLPGVAILWVK